MNSYISYICIFSTYDDSMIFWIHCVLVHFSLWVHIHRVMYMKFRYVHLIIHNHIVCTCVLVLSLFWNCLIVNLAKAGLFAALLGKLQCWKPMFPFPLRGSQAHTAEVQCVTQNEARKRNPFTWKIPTIRVHMIVAFGPSHAVKKRIRRKKHRAIVGHVQNPCRRCFHHCRSRLKVVCG